MKRLLALHGVIGALAGLGCSDEAPTAVAPADASPSDTAAPTLDSMEAGSGTGGGATEDRARMINPNECALQGNFVAHADFKLPTFMCGMAPFSTTYLITIAGTMVTLTQYVEKFPMTGTIDAQCHARIVVKTPLKRDFDVTFDPTGQSATGTYLDGDPDACAAKYDVTMQVQPAE